MDWSSIQGCHLRTAENVIDKLMLLGWTNTTDGLSLLLPSNPSTASDHTALVSWLLPRALGSDGMDHTRREAKGTDRAVDALVSAAAQISFAELDPKQLQRGHGPAICQMLNALCDLALTNQGFTVGPARYDEARWVAAPAPPAEAKGSSGGGNGRRQQQRQQQEQQQHQTQALPSVAEAKGTEASPVEWMRKAKQEAQAQCRGKRARVQQLKEELGILTVKAQEAHRKADVLEPLVAAAAAAQGEEAAAGLRVVASTADTAARVGKMKAARQGLQEEIRRLVVHVGLAQHLLMFGWRYGAREEEGEGWDESLLLRAAEGPGGGLEEDDEEDEEEEDEGSRL